MKTPARISPYLFLVLSLLSVQVAHAQQREVITRISHIAGTTIYLDLGRDDGISAGDTLYVYLDASFRGVLVVESAASHSLSALYATEELFPLTRGQQITVRFEPPVETEEGADTGVEPERPRQSLLDQPSAVPGRERRPTPVVSGRWMTGTSVTYSQTRWGDLIDRTTDRLFVSPFSDLALSVSRLPNGFHVDATASYTYRYSSEQPVVPEHAFRLYRLNIEKRFNRFPLTLSAGRFYNRYDIFSGYWDGLTARIGDRNRGFGIVGGFEPRRGNEQFSSDLPKVSFFTYKEWAGGDTRFSGSTELVFNAVLPSIAVDDHLFAGLHQQFRYGRSRITVSLQADRNPADDRWLLSQTLLRGHVALSDRWELHGAYNRRIPYRMFAVGNPLGYERRQMTGGLTWRFRNGYLGGDVTISDNEFGDESRSFTGYGSISRSRLWDLGYSAVINYQEYDLGRTLRIAPALERHFHRAYLRLGYQFYRSEFLDYRNQTHGGELSILTPLFERWYLNARLASDFSDLLMNNSGYISIWRAF